MPFMQIVKRIGVMLIWLTGPVFVFAAANKNDPYLISRAGPGNVALAAASIIAVVILIRRGYWRRGIAGKALILLWCLPTVSMLAAHASFEWRKRNVLQTDVTQAAKSWPAFRGGIFVIPRSGYAGREGPDLRRLHHQAQYRGTDSGDAARSKSRRFRTSGGPPACHP